MYLCVKYVFDKSSRHFIVPKLCIKYYVSPCIVQIKHDIIPTLVYLLPVIYIVLVYTMQQSVRLLRRCKKYSELLIFRRRVIRLGKSMAFFFLRGARGSLVCGFFRSGKIGPRSSSTLRFYIAGEYYAGMYLRSPEFKLEINVGESEWKPCKILGFCSV